MPCQVGMTTNPEERKKQWKSKYKSLTNWEILYKCSSKSDAQDKEIKVAKARRCDYGPGGSGPDYATWYVYYFTHSGY